MIYILHSHQVEWKILNDVSCLNLVVNHLPIWVDINNIYHIGLQKYTAARVLLVQIGTQNILVCWKFNVRYNWNHFIVKISETLRKKEIREKYWWILCLINVVHWLLLTTTSFWLHCKKAQQCFFKLCKV